MLTESQVQRSFQKLVSASQLSETELQKADELLMHLRPESPLRFRLTEELEELRRLLVVSQP